MRKKIMAAGALLIVIGIVVFMFTSSIVEGHTSVSGKMSSRGSQEWVSGELNVTRGTDIIITMSNNMTVGLVPASDLGSLTQATFQKYSVQPNVKGNSTNDFIHTYLNNSGSYYVVAFSQSSPQLHYTIIRDAGYVSTLDFANFMGIMVLAAGIVVLVLGVFLRPRHKSRERLED